MALSSTMLRQTRRVHHSLVQQRAFSSASSATSLSDDVETLDVTIVGGGIVGSALACLLKSSPIAHGKKIALIENNPVKILSDAPDLRVYTITPNSKQFFEKIGVWEKIDENKKSAFGTMQVWDSMGEGFIRFDAKKAGHNDLGYVIENSVLQHALMKRMKELASNDDPEPLRIHCPANVKNYVKPNSDTMRTGSLTLDDNTSFKSQLVVAADGGESLIRSLSGLGTWGWEYDQNAVVATIKTDALSQTAYQRFFPTGPLALLPMRDGYTSIVWSCNDEMAMELTSIEPQEFISRLNKAIFNASTTPPPPSFPGLPLFDDVFKNVHNALHTILAAAAQTDPFVAPAKPTELVGKRFAFPLKMKHATTYTKQGVALIGDSAHTIHPLAGQGLNLGLLDVQSLGDVLINGIKSGSGLGSEILLQEYEQDRKAANIQMAVTMDGFKRLFGPNPDAVKVARNVGMGTLNAVEPLKNQIMRYAETI